MIPVTLHWTSILLMISYMGFCGVFALNIEMDNIGLVAIPMDLDPSVVYLNLDTNHITAISELSLSNYTELQTFFIRRNDISYIHRLAFVHNTKLSRLSVVSNTHLLPGEWLIPLRSTLNVFGVARIENRWKILQSVISDICDIYSPRYIAIGKRFSTSLVSLLNSLVLV